MTLNIIILSMANWFAIKNNLQVSTEALRKDIQYHRKALECCTKEFLYYRDIKTSLAEAYAQLAHEYYRAYEYNTALNFYQKALEHNPHHFQVINQIGVIYLKQRKFSQAIDTFEKIIYLATEPYDIIHKVDALLSLGIAYANLDVKGAVNKAYKYVIEAELIYPEYDLINHVMQKIIYIEKNKTTDNKQTFSFLYNPSSQVSSEISEDIENYNYNALV